MGIGIYDDSEIYIVDIVARACFICVRNNVKGKRAELGYILLCIVFSKLCVCSLIYKKRGPRTLCFCALTPSLGNPHLLTIRDAGTLLSNNMRS
jgi:hypothetical protein